MTGTQISGVGAMVMNVGVSTAYSQQDAGSIVSFSDYMKSNTSGMQNKEANTGVETSTVKEYTDTKKIPQRVREVKTEQTSDQQNIYKEDAKEKLEQKSEQFIEEVAEELGVSKEEVELAMENLGMTAMMLFQPEMLTKLVVEISGEGDMFSLITNGELFDSLGILLGEAENILGQVQESLSLTPEEMQNLMQELLQSETLDTKTSGQTEEVLLNENEVSDEDTTTFSKSAKTLETLISDSMKEGHLAETQEDVLEENSEEKMPSKTDAVQMGTVDQEEALHGDISGKENQLSGQSEFDLKNQHTDQEPNGKNNAEGNQMFFQNQTNFTNGTVNQTLTQPVAAYVSTAQQIGDQMIEYIKMNTSPGVTEMEIQLQPASLGNINLQLTLRNGAVTAQFIAQNEEVKNAIEQQVVQLKSTLEEQGVKIEAVEVTIASHEFERAMEQGGQWQNEQQEEQTSNASKARRRVVLSELEAEDELSSDEILQVQMMKQNGTTIELEA